jgi:hypothetical protein
MLENPEDLMDQRLSSISTNFESTDNDDKKLNLEIKNSISISQNKEEENPNIIENKKKIT